MQEPRRRAPAAKANFPYLSATKGRPSIAGVFARLEAPVDFEALDDQPVDLVFLLLAPEGAGADHLKALSRIARVLRDADTVAKIRGTRDAAAIHALLSQTPASHAA